MSDTQLGASEVQAQYASQVAADLGRNTQEQERLVAEAARIEHELSALRRDHALLLDVQEALGGRAAAAESSKNEKDHEADAQVKVPKARSTAVPASTTARPRKSSVSGTSAQASSNDSTEKPARRTLVSVVREHLGQRSEPRSAAEITADLAKAHPDRTIKATVVRTTLEGLVAKGLARRTKQGAAVFYSAPATATSSEED